MPIICSVHASRSGSAADDNTTGPHLVHGLACGSGIQLREQLSHRRHGFWVEVYSFIGRNGHTHLRTAAMVSCQTSSC